MSQPNAVGLTPILEGTFPRTCRTCGHAFETFDDYLTNTEPRIFREFHDRGQLPIVQCRRSCRCGESIAEPCSDRRNVSRAGSTARLQFAHLRAVLCQLGFDDLDATTELRRAVHDEPHSLFDD